MPPQAQRTEQSPPPVAAGHRVVHMSPVGVVQGPHQHVYAALAPQGYVRAQTTSATAFSWQVGSSPPAKAHMVQLPQPQQARQILAPMTVSRPLQSGPLTVQRPSQLPPPVRTVPRSPPAVHRTVQPVGTTMCMSPPRAVGRRSPPVPAMKEGPSPLVPSHFVPPLSFQSLRLGPGTGAFAMPTPVPVRSDPGRPVPSTAAPPVVVSPGPQLIMVQQSPRVLTVPALPAPAPRPVGPLR